MVKIVRFNLISKIEYTYSKTEYDRYCGREYIEQCISNQLEIDRETGRTFVLISGWKGNGKDYIGNIIEKEYGYKKEKIAKSLKDKVSNIYNISLELLESQEGKNTLFETGETYRELLIRHGEEIRIQDNYYWVKELVNRTEGDIVISDWRFVEEYEYIKNTGSNIITIRVERFDRIDTDCKTENSLEDFKFDYKISNKIGTTVDEIINSLKKCKKLK
jgi:transcriptional regulator